MTNSVTQPETNNTITSVIAVIGGAAAVTVIGGGVGIVGAFGAVGLGALDVFAGGAILSGIVAHKTQKSFKPKAKPKPVEEAPVDMTSQEIIDLQRGVF